MVLESSSASIAYLRLVVRHCIAEGFSFTTLSNPIEIYTNISIYDDAGVMKRVLCTVDAEACPLHRHAVLPSQLQIHTQFFPLSNFSTPALYPHRTAIIVQCMQKVSDGLRQADQCTIQFSGHRMGSKQMLGVRLRGCDRAARR